MLDIGDTVLLLKNDRSTGAITMAKKSVSKSTGFFKEGELPASVDPRASVRAQPKQAPPRTKKKAGVGPGFFGPDGKPNYASK